MNFESTSSIRPGLTSGAREQLGSSHSNQMTLGNGRSVIQSAQKQVTFMRMGDQDTKGQANSSNAQTGSAHTLASKPANNQASKSGSKKSSKPSRKPNFRPYRKRKN